MNPRIFSSVAALSAALAQTSARLISFDVFDTLVLRRVPPDVVLTSVSRGAEAIVCRRGHTLRETGHQAYHETYRFLAGRNVSAGLDCEVFAHDLYPHWIKRLSQGSLTGEALTEAAAELAALMTRTEIEVCYPNLDLVSLLEKLKQQGVRLIYTSDMYVGGEVIADLLEAVGLKPYFDKGYVSSDVALLKRTGRLFPHVRQTESAGADFLHIGDDPVSDGKAAAQANVNAFVLRDRAALAQKRKVLFDFRATQKDSTWGGFAVAAYAQARPAELGSREEAYGRRVLGPIIAPFVHRIVERCVAERIEHVYFLAREGLVLKDAFEHIAHRLLPTYLRPKTTYLGVSRLTALAYSTQVFGPREVALAKMNGTVSVDNLFAALNLSAQEKETIARLVHAQSSKQRLHDAVLSSPAFLRLFAHPMLQKAAKQRYETVGKLLHDYLVQQGFFSAHRVAVVDLGWSAQIQESLALGAMRHPAAPQIFGFYLGLTSLAHHRRTDQSLLESLVCEVSNCDWNSSMALHVPAILEAAVRAPHGTVVGYERLADGTVFPKFKSDDAPSRKAEKSNEIMIALFQEGIRAYVHKYAQAVDHLGLVAEQTIPYAHEMIQRLLRFPDVTEATWLLGLKNVADLGSEKLIQMGHTGRTVSRLNLLGWRRATWKTAWHHGTLALYAGRFGQSVGALVADVKRFPQRAIAMPQNRAPDKPGLPTNVGKLLPHVPPPTDFEAVARLRAQQLSLWAPLVRPKVDMAPLTQPLDLQHVLLSKTLFRMARVVARLRCRHDITQGGLHIWPYLAGLTAR